MQMKMKLEKSGKNLKNIAKKVFLIEKKNHLKKVFLIEKKKNLKKEFFRNTNNYYSTLI